MELIIFSSMCSRLLALVRDRVLLSTGYNGSGRGLPHCDEVGHLMEADHCVATVHAELNALLQAAKTGVMVNGATLYVTASPCWGCFKALINAGICKIVYGAFYREGRVMSLASQVGIELLHVPVSS
jgi:dCMP deaminase